MIAFAGAVSAPRFRIIDPDSYGILASIFTLAYPIIGGMGSIWGGLVGGGVLRILPEVLRPLADYIELDLLRAGRRDAYILSRRTGRSAEGVRAPPARRARTGGCSSEYRFGRGGRPAQRDADSHA